MKLDKPGARSISLAEFIAGLKLSEQLDDELTPTAVKEIWLATLSFDVRPDLVSEVTAIFVAIACKAPVIVSGITALKRLNFDTCCFPG
jgi:hypothetical protein